jgi:fructose-1,6-bisphosphatase III
MSAKLTLPKGTVHIISDIPGEDRKLRHVINNASGTLRPLVERLFKDKMGTEELRPIATLVNTKTTARHRPDDKLLKFLKYL